MDSAAAAAPALALALMHEPFYQAMTAGAGSLREKILTGYMEYSLREAQRIGRCVYASDPHMGAAAWTLPQPHDIESRETDAKRRFLRELLPAEGFSQHQRIVAVMATHSTGLLPAHAWYLSIIGVHPQAHGRGIGAALLAPTLAEASVAHACTYLETFDVRNHGFYARAGFVHASSIEEPVTQARYWILRQDF